MSDLTIRVPKLHFLPMEDFLWRVTDGRGGKNTKRCGPCFGACGKPYQWAGANRMLTTQLVVKKKGTFVYKAHAPPHEIGFAHAGRRKEVGFCFPW